MGLTSRCVIGGPLYLAADRKFIGQKKQFQPIGLGRAFYQLLLRFSRCSRYPLPRGYESCTGVQCSGFGMRGCKCVLCWSWVTTDDDTFQIHCSLQELVDDLEYGFSATPIYRSMHGVLMGLICKTDRDPYHGPKLRRSLERWAHNGRCVMFSCTTISRWENAQIHWQNAMWGPSSIIADLRSSCPSWLTAARIGTPLLTIFLFVHEPTNVYISNHRLSKY